MPATQTANPPAAAVGSCSRRSPGSRRPISLPTSRSCRRADRRALAKLVEASKVIDALFLRQVWVGNEAMLLDLVRDETPAGRARLHYFLINKGPWSRLDHNEPFVAGAPPSRRARNFYPAGATKEEIEKWIASLPEAERAARDRLLHRHPPRRRTGSSRPCRTAWSIRTSWRSVGRSAARGRRPIAAEPTLKAFLDEARRRVPVERLLRQRRRLDGAQGRHRADHRAVRGLRGRVLQLQGGVRVVHHRPRRCRERASCRSSAASCRTSRTTCRSTRSIATRSSARWRRSSVVNEIFAAGDGNRGVQTAAFNLPNDERVIREKGSKRVMLKNVQDAKFAKTLVPISKVVLCRRRPEGPRVRRVLHAHPDARADARPRPAQHHRRRPRDDRPAGDEGSVELPRGSQGRYLRPVRAAAPDRQGRRSPKSMERTIYTTFLASASGRSASASTKRTARASRSS